ncbi:uncharacterized protein LOC143460566 isoform X2 [Clavelina lepadiformis]|uniref:uncharacterized protein LOC143460566 isoform X2 n=1 Tax=Clavelina lepadiformis TaxID=159417 RepID=UPI0040412845
MNTARRMALFAKINSLSSSCSLSNNGKQCYQPTSLIPVAPVGCVHAQPITSDLYQGKRTSGSGAHLMADTADKQFVKGTSKKMSKHEPVFNPWVKRKSIVGEANVAMKPTSCIIRLDNPPNIVESATKVFPVKDSIVTQLKKPQCSNPTSSIFGHNNSNQSKTLTSPVAFTGFVTANNRPLTCSVSSMSAAENLVNEVSFAPKGHKSRNNINVLKKHNVPCKTYGVVADKSLALSKNSWNKANKLFNGIVEDKFRRHTGSDLNAFTTFYTASHYTNQTGIADQGNTRLETIFEPLQKSQESESIDENREITGGVKTSHLANVRTNFTSAVTRGKKSCYTSAPLSRINHNNKVYKPPRKSASLKLVNLAPRRHDPKLADQKQLGVRQDYGA